jgi:hypothetical protein
MSSSSAAAAAAFLMAMPPSKGDLYNDDELFELLTIHQSLSTANDVDSTAKIIDDESIVLGLGGSGGVHEWVLQCLNGDLGDDDVDAQSTNANGNPTVEISTIPVLHKFVLETIGDGNSPAAASSSNDKVGGDNGTYSINQLAYENLQTLLTDRKPNIRAIATGRS